MGQVVRVGWFHAATPSATIRTKLWLFIPRYSPVWFNGGMAGPPPLPAPDSALQQRAFSRARLSRLRVCLRPPPARIVNAYLPTTPPRYTPFFTCTPPHISPTRFAFYFPLHTPPPRARALPWFCFTPPPYMAAACGRMNSAVCVSNSCCQRTPTPGQPRAICRHYPFILFAVHHPYCLPFACGFAVHIAYLHDIIHVASGWWFWTRAFF